MTFGQNDSAEDQLGELHNNPYFMLGMSFHYLGPSDVSRKKKPCIGYKGLVFRAKVSVHVFLTKAYSLLLCAAATFCGCQRHFQGDCGFVRRYGISR